MQEYARLKTPGNIYRLMPIWVMVIVSCILPAAAPAQSSCFFITNDRAVSLEFFKPLIRYEESPNTLNMVTFLSYQNSINDKITFFVDIPLAIYGADGGAINNFTDLSGKSTSTTAGNALLGAKFWNDDKSGEISFALRLPIVQRKELAAAIYGGITDLARTEAFDYDRLYAIARYVYIVKTGSRASYRLGVGSAASITNPGNTDAEFNVHYSGHVLYQGESVNCGFGLNGIYFLNVPGANAVDFTARTMHQVEFLAGLRNHRFRPGFQIIFPMDQNIKDLARMVIGINCLILI